MYAICHQLSELLGWKLQADRVQCLRIVRYWILWRRDHHSLHRLSNWVLEVHICDCLHRVQGCSWPQSLSARNLVPGGLPFNVLRGDQWNGISGLQLMCRSLCDLLWFGYQLLDLRR